MPIHGTPSKYGLENHGLKNLSNEYWNYSPASLVEEAVCRFEGELSADGALIASTGKHTGRSPNDKFVVQHPELSDKPICWGKVNTPISSEKFDQFYQKMLAYYQGRDVFVQDLRVGAHPNYSLPIRVITEKAWHNLFAQNLFIRLPQDQLADHVPQYTVIQAEDFKATPEIDGTHSETAVIVDLVKQIILVCGTGYAGEIKKSIFTIMNYLLPLKGVLSMHCSANVGKSGDTALFFGLSGTGKTTLSSDPERQLIGDDEHGWADEGVFNFEGGCYAKTIRLNPDYEPIIWSATRRFGAVLENVDYDPVTRQVDFDSDRITENTRGAYPLHFVPNHVESGYAGHPDNVFFLTADAFGVLPPLARLTSDQAMYYFLSGYTSKLAGTETGLGSEPEATFSTCFGSPFLPLYPQVYANLLGERIARHKSTVWLVNTGWTGGPYGVGSRFKLPYTRAMIHAALNHGLNDVAFHQDTFFGLWIPESCPGVPSDVLDPQSTWADRKAYEIQAKNLITRFEQNFVKFADQVPMGAAVNRPRGS